MASSSSNKLVVPEAKAALERFKMECANEVGVNYKQGYNGDMTSREAGSIGGQMVKKMIETIRKIRDGHEPTDTQSPESHSHTSRRYKYTHG